jgi:hypothetical protein
MPDPPDRYEPRAGDIAAEVIEGEAVIINLATGVYYSLDGVAGTIWRLVSDRLDVASIVNRLVASYEVDMADAERDVRNVLRQLLDEGLIEPAGAGAGAGPADPRPPADRAPYVTPAVEVFRDMQDLLALDPPSPGLNGVVWKRPTEHS